MKKPDPVFSVAALAQRLRDDLHVPSNATLCVALSGGLDSTVLLHALSSLRRDYPLSLSAIHIDHGLHPDSAKWSEHCQAFCGSLDIALQIQRVRVEQGQGDGLEAAARRARYAAIAEMIPTGADLVTAHHADDQAETVLLQLLRGAGVAGLAGMAKQRQSVSFALLRPLLDVPRTALESYARQHGLNWIEDPSNTNDQLRRNFLRTDILPHLEQRWPGARQSLARAAEHAAEAQALLDDLARRDLEPVRAGQTHNLLISGLNKLPSARQRNALRHWLCSLHFQSPDTRKLAEIQLLLLNMPRSGHACVRCGNYEVWRYRDQLMAIPREPVPEALDVEWDLRAPIEIAGIGRLHGEQVTGSGLAVRSLRDLSLRISLRRGGEQMLLAGRSHHHRLKKLLQEAGVPPWERKRMPLLFHGLELAAVADRWVCRDFAAGESEPGLRIVWTPFPNHPKRL